ncbi:MAG: cell division protein FtsZ, partial [Candidatus Promineifilaceae bacterium]
VKAVMAHGGTALMAVAEAEGDERAREAANRAINSNLLDISIDGAQGILFNVTGGPDLTLFEVYEAAAIVRETAHPDANIIFGAVMDDTMTGRLRLTVVATGFERPEPRSALAPIIERAQAPAQEDKPAGAGSSAPRRAPAGQNSWAKPTFSPNDLEVPAFLRRR